MQLCILVLIECVAFTAIFAFSASNPMYVIELDQTLMVHGSFRFFVALAAVVGVVGMLVLAKNLLEFMAASEEFVELERLATLGKFSDWTSHQIRNPLAVIRAQVQVLSLNSNNESVARACKLIMRQSDKMSDLLSLMTTLAQPVLSHREVVDLSAMLSEILEAYRATYPAIKFNLTGSFAGVIIGHPGLLEEAFKNVITNSVENIDGAGAVTVVCSESRGFVTVVVYDSGPGISSKAMTSAFEVGFTTKRHGTGLGLPIVRTILAAHGGSASIEKAQRNCPQKGTAVSFQFPRVDLNADERSIPRWPQTRAPVKFKSPHNWGQRDLV